MMEIGVRKTWLYHSLGSELHLLCEGIQAEDQ